MIIVSLFVIAACAVSARPREKALVATSFELPSAPFLAAMARATP
jgi:hypothetical protein